MKTAAAVFMATGSANHWICAESPKRQVLVDGRDRTAFLTHAFTPPGKIESYLKQLFPDAPEGAVLKWNGAVTGAFTKLHSTQILVLCHWEDSPRGSGEHPTEWRAGVFEDQTLLRRLKLADGFGASEGTLLRSARDLDIDGIDEILAGDDWLLHVLQLRPARLRLVYSQMHFFDPNPAPILRADGLDPLPGSYTYFAGEISFNGRLPLSPKSFSTRSFRRQVSRGQEGTWEPTKDTPWKSQLNRRP